ncbi:hypothetical protein AB0B89_15135 [Sphaerisporangium sp. NPDC049002]|uniref:hypothetical protein n=1 Tax=unclassified Sphaerisporangium TaxID=2630420 RepID=UPI00340563A9
MVITPSRAGPRAVADPDGDPTITPTPTVTPTVPPVCVTAGNYAHTAAGRAHQSGGSTYANGSNDPTGLWNTFTTGRSSSIAERKPTPFHLSP